MMADKQVGLAIRSGIFTLFLVVLLVTAWSADRMGFKVAS
jgi:hypothetical protein